MDKSLNTCICFFWVITYLMHFFHIPDPELLFVMPLAICLTVCLWKHPMQLTLIDIALLLLWGYGLCSPSVNSTSSLTSATNMAVNLMSYFLARCLFLHKYEGVHWLCGNDSIKREAAMFLIEHMSDKIFYTGDLIDKYDTLFSIYDSLHKNGDHAHNPPVIRQAMKKLQEQYGPLDSHRLTVNKDCRYLSSKYLIQNIDWAVKAWLTNPLLKQLDFSTFCEYVLPYRAGCEHPDVYREQFYNEFHVLRDTCTNDTTALLKAFRQAIYIDQHFGQSQTMWQYSIDPSVSQMKRGRNGSCEHTCNLYAWIMRSCGFAI